MISSEDRQAREIINAVVPIEAIHPHPRNYNVHPQFQIDGLKKSLNRFKQYRSVVLWQQADGTYLQVAGHGVVEAMKQRGVTEVRADILPEDTDPLDIEGILAADNQFPLLSTTNDELLAMLLQEQQDAGFDLASLGSDDETLRQMLQAMGDGYGAGDTQERDETEDELPDEIETRCKVGDIWQLGRHRIGCCDAFDPATYKRLLQDAKPDAIITDPPYGMRLDADYSGMVNKLRFVQDKGVKSGRKYNNVKGDDKDFDASAIVNYFPHVQEQFWFGADYYSATLDDTMHTGCWLVWDKRLDESADKMFGSCFELIWSKQKHKRDILRHKWAGIFGTEHEPQRGRQHPTQKPVRLFEDLITRYTQEGQIILDPFMGSGTTLIAAENTNRTVYGCELSPEYIDVIIARWEKHTGQEAHRVS